MESHLLQMRGLKLCVAIQCGGGCCVASFTDAWIETICTTQASCGTVSRIFYRCVD